MSSRTPPETRTPREAWPTPEEETVVTGSDTLVGGPPPVPPPEAAPPADRRIGAGMLLGLGALALVAAGLLIAWLLTHQKNDHKTTTVVVTSAPHTAALPPKVAGTVAVRPIFWADSAFLPRPEKFSPAAK